MSVNFAGSQSAGGRRRRLLATSADQSTSNTSSPKTKGKEAHTFRGTLPRSIIEKTEEIPESPIHSLIPRISWKFHLLLTGLWGMLALMTGLAIALKQAANPETWYFIEFYKANTGTFWKCWHITCLVAVGQLCWINYWYRSHSPQDFKGYYRIWLWTSIISLIAVYMEVTQVTVGVSQYVASQIKLSLTDSTLIISYAFLCGLGFEMVRQVDQEMGECTYGKISLYIFICSSFAMMGLSLVQFEMLSPMMRENLILSLNGAIPLLMLTAVSFFTHRTLYVTAEPSPRRASLLIQGTCQLGYKIRQEIAFGLQKISGMYRLCLKHAGEISEDFTYETYIC